MQLITKRAACCRRARTVVLIRKRLKFSRVADKTGRNASDKDPGVVSRLLNSKRLSRTWTWLTPRPMNRETRALANESAANRADDPRRSYREIRVREKRGQFCQAFLLPACSKTSIYQRAKDIEIFHWQIFHFTFRQWGYFFFNISEVSWKGQCSL